MLEICAIMDRLRPYRAPHADLINFVADRPGHDFRDAIDASKIKTELGRAPRVNDFEGLEEIVAWHLENEARWRAILQRCYSTDRLGFASLTDGTKKVGGAAR